MLKLKAGWICKHKLHLPWESFLGATIISNSKRVMVVCDVELRDWPDGPLLEVHFDDEPEGERHLFNIKSFESRRFLEVQPSNDQLETIKNFLNRIDVKRKEVAQKKIEDQKVAAAAEYLPAAQQFDPLIFDLDNTLVKTSHLDRSRGRENVEKNSPEFDEKLRNEALHLRPIIPEITLQSMRRSADRNSMKKEFVVLAKSVKYGQYCIAGREIIRNGSILHLGPWIRPISDHDNGALSKSEIKFEDGSIPNILDIIEIDVNEHVKNVTQPENWTIKNMKWKKTGRVGVESVFRHAIEKPNSIWNGVFCQHDRITTDQYNINGYNSSLCIIKPESYVMAISTIHNEFEVGLKKQRRGKFLYNGVNYDLAITDPDIDRKYFWPFPGVDDGVKQISMDANKCLLCISLTQEFKGYHYKLIATIIENE